jgi:soluble lytic murein transglycosylase-like protein
MAAMWLAAPMVHTAAAQVDTGTTSTTAAARPAVAPISAASAASVDSASLIADLLTANGASRERAMPAAAAIMKYARLRSLDPLLLVGIIGVENATLVPRARSSVGATGVMQVMPLWKKHIRDCGDDLRQVDVNVCFGTRILRIALDETKTVREALLRYNGCVRSPTCHKYAAAVFSWAGRAVLMNRLTPDTRLALARTTTGAALEAGM